MAGGAPLRSDPVQEGPPGSLVGLPVGRPPGREWHREHGDRPGAADRGCWFYASLPADAASGGRFDVPAPEGTCYFASRPLVAGLERVGRFTAARRPVPADLVAGRVVTTVDVVDLPARAVNLVARRAASHFGVTGELFAGSDYAVGQAWAAAVRGAGHEGLQYTPRFSPGGRALAVFGPQGPHPQGTVGVQSLADVLAAGGVEVVGVPPARGLRIVAPPASAPGAGR